MPGKPKIIVSVTSDLTTDQRVHRTCLTLQKQGFEVMLIGRRLPRSLPMPDRGYACRRLNLWFYKGPMFYAAFNFKLFWLLLFSKADALFANDLDSLAANYLASKLKRVYLVYDSHEYYTGVPELEHRPIIRGFWHYIEKFIFPSLKCVITVNESIASLYEKEYGKKPIVIRNVPLKPEINISANNLADLRKAVGLPTDKKVIILQGAGINIQRGAEEAVEAMQYLENTVLVILGGGDVFNILKSIVTQHHLEEKVIFKNKMPYAEMMKITSVCDAGLSLDKDTNLNYRFSLPNKIFDYIHAGIPILASRLPEVEKIVKGYDVGDFIDRHEPRHIAEKIASLFSDEAKCARWKKNLQLAAAELSWQQEEKKFPDIIHELR